jgi:hypothetical protein
MLTDRELVSRFESLGGAGHGCEFGIFQRTHGAEPLGLLRWADLGPELLAQMLEHRFEGVGSKDNVILFVPKTTGRSEYWTRDVRYWMAMRTFVFEDDVPFDQMHAQMCARIQFLKAKLIEDLEEGQKIFVYKDLRRTLARTLVDRIHRAVRAFGENTFLYVGYAGGDHPPESVEVVGPGLLLGYTDRFAFSPEDVNLGPADRQWLAICKAAHELWNSAERRQAADR